MKPDTWRVVGSVNYGAHYRVMIDACRSQPKRQLKRLYVTQDSADADTDAGNADDDEEDLLEPVFEKGAGAGRSFPPIGRMSGLGPSEQAMQGNFLHSLVPSFCGARSAWLAPVARNDQGVNKFKKSKHTSHALGNLSCAALESCIPHIA